MMLMVHEFHYVIYQDKQKFFIEWYKLACTENN